MLCHCTSAPSSLAPPLVLSTHPPIGWIPPVLETVVDLDFYYRSCPVDTTVPGVFFTDIFRLVMSKHPSAIDRLCDQVSARRWVAFKMYPQRDFIRLVANAARILHPNVPLAEGLRRIGRIAYASLGATMAGRVVLFAFGQTLEAAFRNAAKAYKLVLPHASVTIEVGNQRGRIELLNVHNFATTYHLGVFEGTIAEHGFRPIIHVHPGARYCDASFDVEWS